MNFLNVSMYIHVDLALIPMALYWNEKGNQAKVLAPFVQIQTKKLKHKIEWHYSIGSQQKTTPVEYEPSF